MDDIKMLALQQSAESDLLVPGGGVVLPLQHPGYGPVADVIFSAVFNPN